MGILLHKENKILDEFIWDWNRFNISEIRHSVGIWNGWSCIDMWPFKYNWVDQTIFWNLLGRNWNIDKKVYEYEIVEWVETSEGWLVARTIREYYINNSQLATRIVKDIFIKKCLKIKE